MRLYFVIVLLKSFQNFCLILSQKETSRTACRKINHIWLLFFLWTWFLVNFKKINNEKSFSLGNTLCHTLHISRALFKIYEVYVLNPATNLERSRIRKWHQMEKFKTCAWLPQGRPLCLGKKLVLEKYHRK